MCGETLIMNITVKLPFDPPIEFSEENVDRILEVLNRPEFENLRDGMKVELELAAATPVPKEEKR